MTFWISADFEKAWGQRPSFDDIMALQGERFRELDNRRTLRFERNGETFFAKLHYGVGWPEIIKNLLQFRLPIVSAKNEWKAIHHLTQHGVGTMTLMAYGLRGTNPATCQSFVITREVTNSINLEELTLPWNTQPPAPRFKRALIHTLAKATRTMVSSGMNHRDFYLCHFLMHKTDIGVDKPDLFLIDLHRAGLRSKVPHRWLLKDLAGLYFSSLENGFSRKNYLRFVRLYEGRPLCEHDAKFWALVEQKARALFRKHHRREPPTAFFPENK